MTITSELDARIEIKAFVDRSRAANSEWYVGVTADPEARISAHGLEESDWYIVRRLATAEAAARVAEALLKAGCDGSASEAAREGDEEPAGEPTTVYAYWKRGHTTP
ncbi:MAG: hypothetical protein Q8Q00_08430 [Dehalococcoidia bacterium]|nr:hypothetical protein [Dehalococcoidia bacterium]